MIHLIENYLCLALRSFRDPPAEDVGDTICGDTGQPKITGALEDRMDRMVAFENDVLGMLNLADEVVATKVHAVTFVLRELRSQHECPMVEPFLNTVWVDMIGRRLQGSRVAHGDKGVFFHAEPNTLRLKHTGNDVMAVEVVRGIERQEGSNAHGEGTNLRTSFCAQAMGISFFRV